MITIAIAPMGAVRMTQRGKWSSPTAIRYMNYKKDVGYQLRAQCQEPLEGAVSVDVTFILPMPDSWSRKRKNANAGLPVTVKPDADNILKGLMDAANKILWIDDNQVTDVTMKKRYGFQGSIEMTITPVEVVGA